MKAEKMRHRVLVVSASDKFSESVTDILPQNEFTVTARAKSAGEARRMLISLQTDILIINTPLPDDFGVQLALDMSDSNMGILLLVKNDMYEQVAYKVEDNGIFTLAKPNSRQTVYSALKLLAAYNIKLSKLEEKTRSLQEKMNDIRIVNRAKWLLIENLNMNEKDAHYYIEKQAMDSRVPRREVAESIIRTYDS